MPQNMSSKHLLPLYIIKFIKNSWNEYLINVCKSVRNASWFTSTFRSIFSAKTAYIFKIVDKPEAYPMIVSDLYLIYKRSTSTRVCISEKERMLMFYLSLKDSKECPILDQNTSFRKCMIKKNDSAITSLFNPLLVWSRDEIFFLVFDILLTSDILADKHCRL